MNEYKLLCIIPGETDIFLLASLTDTLRQWAQDYTGDVKAVVNDRKEIEVREFPPQEGE